MRVICMINNEPIDPYSITTDDKKSVYISNFKNECVMWTDLDINLIRSYKTDYSPTGICYSNDQLFVCYYYERFIGIFSSELKPMQHVNFRSKPNRVAALDTTICVHFSSSFYICDCDGLRLKRIKNIAFNKIISFNSMFYAFTSNNIYCYSSKGTLLRVIDLSKMNNNIKGFSDGATVIFNDSIIIASASKQKFLKIPIKN